MYWLIKFIHNQNAKTIYSCGIPIIDQYELSEYNIRMTTNLNRKITFSYAENHEIWKLKNYYTDCTQEYYLNYNCNGIRPTEIITRYTNGNEKKWSYGLEKTFSSRSADDIYILAYYTVYDQLRYITGDFESYYIVYSIYNNEINASIKPNNTIGPSYIQSVTVSLTLPVGFIPSLDKLFPSDWVIN